MLGHITPAVLNSYYNITTNTGNTLASQAVFESLGQYYSPADLVQFEAYFGIPLYNVTTDIGGYESDAECVADANNCAEANLGPSIALKSYSDSNNVSNMACRCPIHDGDISSDPDDLLVRWIDGLFSKLDHGCRRFGESASRQLYFLRRHRDIGPFVNR